ncbi:hypothetical protein [Tunturiibacter empetritectus]|uniref:hypothetical protein n=1 Tax=Tunturiibacter empetritectus TaxID=3069691 RepID=UPI003D9ADBD0
MKAGTEAARDVSSRHALEQPEVRDRLASSYLQERVRKNLIELSGHSPFAMAGW